MKYKIFFLVLTVLFLPFTAFAQSAGSGLLYAPTTPQYLAKTYWLLNGIDPENSENIDQYLMVTECDLFTQYYNNDIEWNKIREATKTYIETNKKSFPTRFEFVQPIMLDRYDLTTGSFSMAKNYEMAGVKQFQISGNEVHDFACLDNNKYKPETFPLNAVVTISRPINYTQVKAEKAVVEEYLKYMADHNLQTQQGRPAYVRYRLKIEQSLKPIQGDHEIFANFFGSLESMTIFGDKEMFIKLEDVKL